MWMHHRFIVDLSLASRALGISFNIFDFEHPPLFFCICKKSSFKIPAQVLLTTVTAVTVEDFNRTGHFESETYIRAISQRRLGLKAMRSKYSNITGHSNSHLQPYKCEHTPHVHRHTDFSMNHSVCSFKGSRVKTSGWLCS